MREPTIEKKIKKRRLLTPQTCAAALGLNPQTLANHRIKRIGLPYVKIGKRVFYDTHDVANYIQKNKVYHD